MTDKRKYPRAPVDSEAIIKHRSIGEQGVIVRDASDGGLYIVTHSTELPPVGSIVTVMVKGAGEEEMQSCNMQVVRMDENKLGMGLIPCEP